MVSSDSSPGFNSCGRPKNSVEAQLDNFHNFCHLVVADNSVWLLLGDFNPGRTWPGRLRAGTLAAHAKFRGYRLPYLLIALVIIIVVDLLIVPKPDPEPPSMV